MDLSHRVALVTGGKRIGAVVAVELARQGADIGLCYNRSRDETEKTAASITALGRQVFMKQADLARAADGEAFVNESAGALGRVDVLINMASIYVSTPFNELTVDAFDQGVAVDLRSAFIWLPRSAPCVFSSVTTPAAPFSSVTAARRSSMGSMVMSFR